MDRFWKWLLLLSKRKVKERHLRKVGNDIKCPHCNEWFSISGVEFKHKHFDEVFGSCAECGKCEQISYWNLVAAPMPLLCDSQGTPLSVKT